MQYRPQGAAFRPNEIRPGTNVRSDNGWTGSVVQHVPATRENEGGVSVAWHGDGTTVVSYSMLQFDNGEWVIRSQPVAAPVVQEPQPVQPMQPTDRTSALPVDPQDDVTRLPTDGSPYAAPDEATRLAYDRDSAARVQEPASSMFAPPVNEEYIREDVARAAGRQEEEMAPRVNPYLNAPPLDAPADTPLNDENRPVGMIPETNYGDVASSPGYAGQPAVVENPMGGQPVIEPPVMERPMRERPVVRMDAESGEIVVPLIEERAEAVPEWREAGNVHVRTVTEEVPETFSQETERDELTVERIAIGRVLNEGEQVLPRQDGDTWIMPVVVEEAVVLTRRVLAEELRVTRRTVRQVQTVQTTLRQQRVEIDSGNLSDRVHDVGGTDSAFSSTSEVSPDETSGEYGAEGSMNRRKRE